MCPGFFPYKDIMNQTSESYSALLSSGRSGGLLPLAAGFCALIIAMGVGRFVYTSLLPGMMAVHGFGEAAAGAMAGWNYVGYLAGALAMRGVSTGARYRFFVFWMLLSLATTMGMGLIRGEAAWHTVRFISGVASAGIFVLCSAMVLDALATAGRSALAGLLYSGVGAGIVFGGLLAPFLESRFGTDGAWLGMGIVCLPLASFSLICLRPSYSMQSIQKNSGRNTPPGEKQGGAKRALVSLILAYFLEGLGYIISATFLVAMIGASTGSMALANASWVITGGAAALSAPLWPLIARRTGYLNSLLAAFLLQGVGVLLPVVSSSGTAALGSGLLFGGTFMGITVLSLQYGVSLSSRSSAHTVGTMTVVYGAGQIIGPFVAGMLASEGGGFALSFALSAVCLFLAIGALLLGHLPGKDQAASGR